MENPLINDRSKNLEIQGQFSPLDLSGGHPAAATGRRRHWAWRILLALFVFSLAGSVYAQKTEAWRLDTIKVQDLGPGGESHDIRLPGYDYVGSPVFSPDGAWIAFDAYKSVRENSFTPAECWLVRRDGTGPKKLAAGATPRWSPDGKRLLFMREDQSDPSKDAGVFLIARDGTGERRVCAGRWPDWSPDGERVALGRGGRPGGGARELSRVFIVRADGTEDQEVAEGDCPSWSPDGKRLAFCKKDPALQAPEIRVHDLGTGREEILGFGWWRANWSPDGRTLVSNGVAQPDREVGMIRFTVGGRGPAPEPLLPGWQRGMSPCLSHDGKTVAFVLVRSAE
jgi:Tol biopolymer transport system component